MIKHTSIWPESDYERRSLPISVFISTNIKPKFIMPYARYYSESEQFEDKRPCAGLRADLRDCIMQSDCFKIHKKSPKECLLTRDSTVPDECYQLRQAFFECKRSLLDNRQRFRGRKGY